jgi:hypothetical protein
MLRVTTIVGLSGLLGWADGAAFAQSLPIELGTSRRVGGDGITDEEQARTRAAYAPEEPLTEANLPPPGSKKRIDSLHELAERNAGGRQWKDACRFYDLVLEEAGLEGFDVRERGRIEANKSYLGCANAAFVAREYDRAETLIARGEKILGSTTSRHEALRWKILRDQYRAKVGAGDLGGATRLYGRMQDMRQSEDERIWFGEQLARLAWDAHNEGDELRRDTLITAAEEVAPRNVELRRLQDTLQLGDEVLRNILFYGIGSAAVLGLLTLFSRWRQRALVGAAARPKRKKNPFLDEEDELA